MKFIQPEGKREIKTGTVMTDTQTAKPGGIEEINEKLDRILAAEEARAAIGTEVKKSEHTDFSTN